MAGRALPKARSVGREPAKCCIRGRVDSVRRWDERVHTKYRVGSTESYSVDSAHMILAVIYMIFLLCCFDGIYTTMHSTGDSHRCGCRRCSGASKSCGTPYRPRDRMRRMRSAWLAVAVSDGPSASHQGVSVIERGELTMNRDCVQSLQPHDSVACKVLGSGR